MKDLKKLQREMENEKGETGIRFRPRQRPFIVFFLMFLFLLIQYSYIAITKDSSAWKVVFSMMGVFSLSCCWIYLHIIDIYPDKISYYSLLGGRRSLKISEIRKWSVRIGIYKYTDRYKPTVRLEIEPNAKIGKKPIIIGLKLFQKENIDTLFDILPSDKRK